MATLFLSSSFLLPLSSHKLWQWHPPRKHLSFTICCASSSSSNKSSSSSSSSSRSSRKVKSNEELYNDLREFLSTVGLSESHVPSMKELSAHGRFLFTHLLFFLLGFTCIQKNKRQNYDFW